MMGRSGAVGLWILGWPKRMGHVPDEERNWKYNCLGSTYCLWRVSSFWLSFLSVAGDGFFLKSTKLLQCERTPSRRGATGVQGRGAIIVPPPPPQ